VTGEGETPPIIGGEGGPHLIGDFPLPYPLHHLRVTVIEERTHPRIQRRNRRHLLGRKFKMEDPKA
jgi:hypothetical protein